LREQVLMAMLSCSALKRIVYVSCNPDTLVSNAVTLCTPCPNSGHDAFVPVKAMAVDLFPHTNHCEAVMLLER
jgi:tRNA (uracil-5-)-methyltransferase